jgi:hypothetical protein
VKSKAKILTRQRIVRQTPKSDGDQQEQIRRRAFELYEQRGRGDGFALDDWLQAESELAQSRAKKPLRRSAVA